MTRVRLCWFNPITRYGDVSFRTEKDLPLIHIRPFPGVDFEIVKEY